MESALHARASCMQFKIELDCVLDLFYSLDSCSW